MTFSSPFKIVKAVIGFQSSFYLFYFQGILPFDIYGLYVFTLIKTPS